MITETGIKAALGIAAKLMKRVEINDGGERGAGRLVLSIRPLGGRVTAEWYAYSYRQGRRATLKIGSYPTLGVAAARKLFRETVAPVISSGEWVGKLRKRVVRGQAEATLGAMFDFYLSTLMGRPSHKTAGYVLNEAAKYLGTNKMAAAISTKEIAEFLGTIHARGSVVAASTSRAYLRAAYERAMKSENDYTAHGRVKSWGIRFNPVTAIPSDPNAKRVGNRHLSPEEWSTFFQWLEQWDETWVMAPALRLCMLTGQRIIEIAPLEQRQYDRPNGMLDWQKTKNGHPHSVPLPRQAVDLLDRLPPGMHGRIFLRRNEDDSSVPYNSIKNLIDMFLEANPNIEPFTARDIRRTWKTLAGAAELSKEIRDRIQNHARSDVASRHYDRYEYLAEKRVAMAKWSDYVDWMLGVVPLAAAAE